MSSDLTELGQEAIAAVSRGVTDGAPLVKCQLLASAFYEALRHELRKADATKRGTLLAVTHQCHRSAAANISPVQALHELKRAIDLLQPVTGLRNGAALAKITTGAPRDPRRTFEQLVSRYGASFSASAAPFFRVRCAELAHELSLCSRLMHRSPQHSAEGHP